MNRGKESINITPEINIYSGKEMVEKLVFENRIIESQEEKKLKKILDTKNYKAGDYRAVGVVDYGERVETEIEFRIGSLNVDIINYTNRILIGGIQKFNIEVESKWNNKIENIYALVSIKLNSTSSLDFKTTPVSLNAWKKAKLSGFFETDDFEEGVYNIDMILFYSGKNSTTQGQIEFIKKKKTNLLIFGILIIGFTLIIIISVILIKRYLKNVKKKKK